MMFAGLLFCSKVFLPQISLFLWLGGAITTTTAAATALLFDEAKIEVTHRDSDDGNEGDNIPYFSIGLIHSDYSTNLTGIGAPCLFCKMVSRKPITSKANKAEK